MFLMTSRDFLDFGEYKLIIVNATVNNASFNLHPNVLMKNDTSFKAYWNKIEGSLDSLSDRGYAVIVIGIPIIEINAWNMDLYANKKIKITNNALTGSELITLRDKHSENNTALNLEKASLNKRSYITSTKSNLKADNLQNDKYLTYITPPL
jgi:hypothetical protein